MIYLCDGTRLTLAEQVAMETGIDAVFFFFLPIGTQVRHTTNATPLSAGGYAR